MQREFVCIICVIWHAADAAYWTNCSPILPQIPAQQYTPYTSSHVIGHVTDAIGASESLAVSVKAAVGSL